MGNTDYECGVIPKSIAYIANHKNSMPLVEQSICGTDFLLIINQQKLSGYVQKIEAWIQYDNYDGSGEYHGLQDISNGNNRRCIVGWLDIDENVFFFIKNEEGILMAERFNEALTPESGG